MYSYCSVLGLISWIFLVWCGDGLNVFSYAGKVIAGRLDGLLFSLSCFLLLGMQTLKHPLKQQRP